MQVRSPADSFGCVSLYWSYLWMSVKRANQPHYSRCPSKGSKWGYKVYSSAVLAIFSTTRITCCRWFPHPVGGSTGMRRYSGSILMAISCCAPNRRSLRRINLNYVWWIEDGINNKIALSQPRCGGLGIENIGRLRENARCWYGK